MLLAQGSEAWLAERMKCAATCSEYGTALGLGYRSRCAYWREKTGLTPPAPENDAMAFGREWENHVAGIYDQLMRDRGYRLRRHAYGFLREGDFGGSPDGILEDEQGVRFLLEVKTRPFAYGYREYIPVCHLIQMCGLCAHFKLPFAHYICYTPNVGFELARVDFDPQLWSNVIYPRLCEFAAWVHTRQEPPAMSKKQELSDLIESMCSITWVENTTPLPQ